MKLPHQEQATVSEQKITHYLLSLTHPSGSSKARYFIRHGFSADAWQAFAGVLCQHAADNDVAESLQTPRGVSYTVEGELTSPTGDRLRIRVVWFQDVGERAPHLVTAYPLKGAGA
jgi:hypothetical protein